MKSIYNSPDLNQLRALDVLLQERHVTRAAERLGISQPALSHTLARLRETFGDPLLVRTRGGMVPTPRAKALQGAIREAMTILDEACLPTRPFEPERAEQTFRLELMDHTAAVLLPGVVQRLSVVAPSVDLVCAPWDVHQNFDHLERGDVDLVIRIGPMHDAPANLYRRNLFYDEFVCIARAGHPQVNKALSLETFVQLKHVLISPRGEQNGLVDAALEARGLKRHVAVVVPHFSAAPYVVAATDMIATLSPHLASLYTDSLGLQVFPPPLKVEGGFWHMVWHQRTQNDTAHQWLREQINTVAKSLVRCEDGATR